MQIDQLWGWSCQPCLTIYWKVFFIKKFSSVKTFFLPVKTSCPPVESVDETPYVWFFFAHSRVEPKTELDENTKNEKDTQKQEIQQGSKEKVKSNIQGMAPGLG